MAFIWNKHLDATPRELGSMIRSDGLPYTLMGDKFALSHFNSPRSYARYILDLINREDFFRIYLKNKSNLTILDLGGNIGLFSIYAAPSARRIVTVEPTPSHLSILKQLTNDIPVITIVEAAVSPKNEPVVFYLAGANTTMNSLYNHFNSADKTFVAGKTLKTIMDEQNLTSVDLCKIDIEGSEMFAITDESLAEVDGRIKKICIEMHPTTSSLDDNIRTMGEVFTRAGYSVENVGWDTIIATKI